MAEVLASGWRSSPQQLQRSVAFGGDRSVYTTGGGPDLTFQEVAPSRFSRK